MMTLGVLETYRYTGIGHVLLIGSYLLERTLTLCHQDNEVDKVCLHVHILNDQALRLYKKYGFTVEKMISGYYANNTVVTPPDAYFLSRKLNRR